MHLPRLALACATAFALTGTASAGQVQDIYAEVDGWTIGIVPGTGCTMDKTIDGKLFGITHFGDDELQNVHFQVSFGDWGGDRSNLNIWHGELGPLPAFNPEGLNISMTPVLLNHEQIALSYSSFKDGFVYVAKRGENQVFKADLRGSGNAFRKLEACVKSVLG